MFPNKLLSTSLRQVFLIDCIGAFLSAFMLGLLLPRFEAVIGMPANVLYVLASIASVFALYSFLGYIGKLRKLHNPLKVIAIANILYCCLSIGLMVYYHESLTALGYTYFILEKLTVVSLAAFEWKIAARGHVSTPTS